MDSSFTIKPLPGVGKSRALRDPVPVREAIETELVGSTIVTAMGDGAAKDHGGKDTEQRPNHAPHDLVADPNPRCDLSRARRARRRSRTSGPCLAAAARLSPASEEGILPSSDDDPHADIRA